MTGLPKAASSERVPYVEGEDWEARHQRRLEVALMDRERLLWRLEDLRPRLTTHNGGAHWRIKVGKRVFEWWPQSGRLIVDQQWHKPKKAHDVDQVVKAIVRLVKR
jgi:hypothetical protein